MFRLEADQNKVLGIPIPSAVVVSVEEYERIKVLEYTKMTLTGSNLTCVQEVDNNPICSIQDI